ncbi:MAG TPA: biotin/lipoyl-containing protein, partial [Allosphingosinicella sp.]|nr:biotin/lipoyl-containing protein [Allosphingosinicella sp.]
MIDVLVPEEQEGTQAVVRAWLKQVGDRVEVNDPLVELETDKVAMEVPAPAAGVLREIVLDTGAQAVPGAVLGRIAVGGEGQDQESPSVRPERSRGTVPGEAEADGLGSARRGVSTSLDTNGAGLRDPELRLSPAVKRALLQHDIDPSRIEGSGRDGRITRADVDRAVE